MTFTSRASLDFGAAAAAAAFGVGRVVESLRRINQREPAVDEDPLEMGGPALHAQALDLFDGGEQRVIHRDLLQLVARQGERDLAAEGTVPIRVGAARTGQHEAAVFEVAAEVGALGVLEREIALAGEDAQRRVEDVVFRQRDAGEARRDLQAGFLGGVGEEGVRETDRGLVVSIDEIAAVDGFRVPIERRIGRAGDERREEESVSRILMAWW